MRPVDPDGTVGDEEQGPIAVLKKTWERIKKNGIEPHSTAPAPKLATKAHRTSRLPTQFPTSQIDWAEALSELPDLDRQIFTKIYGTNPGEQPQAPEVVAEEFALPMTNLLRIVGRIEKKLEARGITIR